MATRDTETAPRTHRNAGCGDFGRHTARTDARRGPCRHRIDACIHFANFRNKFRRRVLTRIGGVQSINVRQQDEALGARHLGHARGESVIISVADFGRRHRIVLVDDGDGTEIEQCIEGGAGIEIAAPILGIVEGQ